jgi:hypothetical protein
MIQSIEITKEFPASRERVVLLELLEIVRLLKAEEIDSVICGGWVPFLKELARHCHTSHSMSLDIDLLLRQKARERESIDRVKYLLSKSLNFERSNDDLFRYEKSIDGNLVQLDLMADLPRTTTESVKRFHGLSTTLDMCLIDGAENLGNHTETIRINCREGESVETFELTLPDAVGFLMLKTEVCRYREKQKDPYDIYYYCRYSEDTNVIRQSLINSIQEPAVRNTVSSIRRMFSHEDSKWVEMILDHMGVTEDNDRDQEARMIVRTLGRVIEGMPGE